MGCSSLNSCVNLNCFHCSTGTHYLLCSGVTVLLAAKFLHLYAFLHNSNYVTSILPVVILRYCGQQHNTVAWHSMCGLGSSVGIVTDYRLDGSGIKSRWAREFSHTFRLAQGLSGRGMVLTTHLVLALRLRVSRAIPPLPL
jgi:hypothetical protein